MTLLNLILSYMSIIFLFAYKHHKHFIYAELRNYIYI